MIKNLGLLLLVVFILGCNGDKKTSNEMDMSDIRTVQQDSINSTFQTNVSTFYKRYADSINSLKKGFTKIPDYISEYSDDLKKMESTALHMSKKSVYYEVLNQVETEKLGLLATFLANKPIRNENEEIVLEAIRYLVKNHSKTSIK